MSASVSGSSAAAVTVELETVVAQSWTLLYPGSSFPNLDIVGLIALALAAILIWDMVRRGRG